MEPSFGDVPLSVTYQAVIPRGDNWEVHNHHLAFLKRIKEIPQEALYLSLCTDN